ncbi:TPA: HipA domain-containing protein [Vibrio cholerae]|nr:HipA domain-containing protein [Vibrio cholerae]
MANIKKPSLFLGGLTISQMDADEKYRSGLLNKVSFEDETGKIVGGTNFYIDNLAKTTPELPSSSHKFHYLTALSDMLHILLGANKLFPTPQLNMLNYADDDSFTTINKTAIVMGVDSGEKYTNRLKLCVYNETLKYDVLPIHCLWWDFDIIKSFLTSKADMDLSCFKPPLSSFKYADALGYNRTQINDLRTNLAKSATIQPNKVAYLILNPSKYYESEIGIDSIIRNYIRNASPISNVNELIKHLKTTHLLLSTDPVYIQIKNAKERLAIISDYVIKNSISLDMYIQRESMEIRGAYKAYRFSHYGITENVILLSQVSGTLRYNPHEWVKSTDRSIVNDLKNARFHNLLPENKPFEINKNRVAKITNSSSLIGNYSLTEVPLVRISKMATLDKNNTSNHQFLNEVGNSDLAPSISYHQAEINDFILYRGYFEGIPSYDKQFSGKLMTLMENEFAAKLSGITFKLPLLLCNKNGINELRRQTGNEPFTHIGKFPMPSYEDLTLAEWLALTIIDRSMILEAAQTTLVAFDGNVGPEKINADNLVNQDLEDHALSDKFKNELFDHFSITKQDPPFLLSTRFDIPKNGESLIIKSYDFSELLLKGPEEKYEADFEQIGKWIQENIHDQSSKEAALITVFKQLICSYFLHNNDLHLKNITLLEIKNEMNEEKVFKISPCYDVLITPLVYFDSESDACYRSALRVNGTNHPSVEDIIKCGVQGFGLTEFDASKIFESCFSDMKTTVSVMKVDLPYEIESRPRWKDVVIKGLNVVTRNLRCIEKHNHCYHSGIDNSYQNYLKLSK